MKIINIKKIDSTTNKVTFTSAEGTIDITTQWDSYPVCYSGTDWYIL